MKIRCSSLQGPKDWKNTSIQTRFLLVTFIPRPDSISKVAIVGLTCLRENDVVFLHNKGVQKALLAQIESSGPLCLIEPAEVYQEIIGLGLIPLFLDLPVNTPISTVSFLFCVSLEVE
jgi:hypothetical protein